MKLRGRLKKHTEANHMIWYLSGHFAQWYNPKQKSICFLWFALFHSGLMHCPLFRRCPKIRPCVGLIVGLIQAAEKTSSFQLMDPEQTVVLFYFVCLWSHMYGHIIWPVLRNTEAPWCHGNTASSVHSHTGSIFLTFPASPHFVTAHTLSSCVDLWPRSKSMFCRDDLTTCSYFPPLHTTVHFFPPVQKLEVTERGHCCRHGIWKYEQRGGAEPEGVRAVRAETQHPAAAEGLHCPAVHLQARPAHGLPQGVLREAGEGLFGRN